MADWVTQADRFVAFNERAVLEGPGRASHAEMEHVVQECYGSYDYKRRAAEAEAADREALEELSRIEDEARLLLSNTDKPRRKKAKKTS